MDPNTYPFQQQYPQQQQSPRPLQGPRPSPLRVSKDSHKIKKPPTAPNNPHLAAEAAAPPQYLQPRQPVIIYAVSPKVIPASPGSFMSVVQRLTGPNSSPSAAAAFAASTSSSQQHLPSPSGAVSPAARLASIDQAERAFDAARLQAASPMEAAVDLDFIDSMFDCSGVEVDLTTANIMSILSPNPGSLPGISPDIFSSAPADLNSLGFLNNLMSPAVTGSNFISPAGNFGFGLTPTASLSPVWDAFLPFPSDPPW